MAGNPACPFIVASFNIYASERRYALYDEEVEEIRRILDGLCKGKPVDRLFRALYYLSLAEKAIGVRSMLEYAAAALRELAGLNVIVDPLGEYVEVAEALGMEAPREHEEELARTIGDAVRRLYRVLGSIGETVVDAYRWWTG